jgi:hypothetical protein
VIPILGEDEDGVLQGFVSKLLRHEWLKIVGLQVARQTALLVAGQQANDLPLENNSLPIAQNRARNLYSSDLKLPRIENS